MAFDNNYISVYDPSPWNESFVVECPPICLFVNWNYWKDENTCV